MSAILFWPQCIDKRVIQEAAIDMKQIMKYLHKYFSDMHPAINSPLMHWYETVQSTITLIIVSKMQTTGTQQLID